MIFKDYCDKLTNFSSLPILNQPEYIRQSLEAGKHVLSEKPIAENLKDALELVQWYESNKDLKVTWGVAENYRFMNSYDYARDQVKKLGKLLTFKCQAQGFVKGGKYFGKIDHYLWTQADRL